MIAIVLRLACLPALAASLSVGSPGAIGWTDVLLSMPSGDMTDFHGIDLSEAGKLEAFAGVLSLSFKLKFPAELSRQNRKSPVVYWQKNGFLVCKMYPCNMSARTRRRAAIIIAPT
jgi:hypothetical protein